MTDDKKDERINIGAGMVPTYHATESVEEAKAVVEQCRSATEDLRRMLDERGVEYETFSGAFATKTCWPCANGLTAIFVEYDEGTTRFEMSRWHVAPEQAIAATLGSGKCRPTKREGDGFEYCSECGGMLARWIDYSGKEPGFCPSCGRRVVEE